jgi:hypothetical protein
MKNEADRSQRNIIFAFTQEVRTMGLLPTCIGQLPTTEQSALFAQMPQSYLERFLGQNAFNREIVNEIAEEAARKVRLDQYIDLLVERYVSRKQKESIRCGCFNCVKDTEQLLNWYIVDGHAEDVSIFQNAPERTIKHINRDRWNLLA